MERPILLLPSEQHPTLRQISEGLNCPKPCSRRSWKVVEIYLWITGTTASGYVWQSNLKTNSFKTAELLKLQSRGRRVWYRVSKRVNPKMGQSPAASIKISQRRSSKFSRIQSTWGGKFSSKQFFLKKAQRLSSVGHRYFLNRIRAIFNTLIFSHSSVTRRSRTELKDYMQYLIE
jgi:hypothetical protein